MTTDAAPTEGRTTLTAARRLCSEAGPAPSKRKSSVLIIAGELGRVTGSCPAETHDWGWKDGCENHCGCPGKGDPSEEGFAAVCWKQWAQEQTA